MSVPEFRFHKAPFLSIFGDLEVTSVVVPMVPSGFYSNVVHFETPYYRIEKVIEFVEAYYSQPLTQQAFEMMRCSSKAFKRLKWEDVKDKRYNMAVLLGQAVYLKGWSKVEEEPGRVKLHMKF